MRSRRRTRTSRMRSAASGGAVEDGSVSGEQARGAGRRRPAARARPGTQTRVAGALNGRPALPPRHNIPRSRRAAASQPWRRLALCASGRARAARAAGRPRPAGRAPARSALTSPGGTSRPFVPSVDDVRDARHPRGHHGPPRGQRFQERVGQAVHVSRAIDHGRNGHHVRRRQCPRDGHALRVRPAAPARPSPRCGARGPRADRPRPRWPRAPPGGPPPPPRAGRSPSSPRGARGAAPGTRPAARPSSRSAAASVAEVKAAQSTP